jgi:hypothetical protein
MQLTMGSRNTPLKNNQNIATGPIYRVELDGLILAGASLRSLRKWMWVSASLLVIELSELSRRCS